MLDCMALGADDSLEQSVDSRRDAKLLGRIEAPQILLTPSGDEHEREKGRHERCCVRHLQPSTLKLADQLGSRIAAFVSPEIVGGTPEPRMLRDGQDDRAARLQ